MHDVKNFSGMIWGGIRFPWTEQSSTSKIPGSPVTTGKWGTSKIPQKRCHRWRTRDKSVDTQRDRTRWTIEFALEKLKSIFWKLWSLLWKAPEKYKFGTSENFKDTEKPKRGTLKDGAEFSIIFPKYQGVWNTSCKTKQTQWEEANHDRHQEAYGRRSCWTHKSLPGLYLLSLPSQLGNRTRYSITGRLGRS